MTKPDLLAVVVFGRTYILTVGDQAFLFNKNCGTAMALYAYFSFIKNTIPAHILLNTLNHCIFFLKRQ